MSKRMTETQIVSILKEAEAGISAKELCEPPQDCRRLIFLREYDNENTKLYPRNERASRPYAN